jgi:hypothetical protein
VEATDRTRNDRGRDQRAREQPNEYRSRAVHAAHVSGVFNQAITIDQK